MDDQKQLIAELGRIVHEKDLDGYAKLREEFISSFASSSDGLSLNEVERNRQVFGPNLLPKAKEKTFLLLVWEASQDKVLILLMGAAVLSLLVHFRNGGWIEGVAIISAVVIVILVNAVNDWKKDRLFRSLNQKSQSGLKSKVIRSGLSDLVPNHDLVICDLIQLEPGVSGFCSIYDI
jgi:magnesium-transporting ATPase (P-type)